MSQRSSGTADAGYSVHLRTGEEYRNSMRDGRVVYYGGEQIDDVTQHFATAGLIDWHARMYDAQHEDATRDVLTYVDEDGVRRPTAWLVPRTPEDLRRKREYNEYIAFETFGIPGRSPDTVHWTMIGMLAVREEFEKHCPELAPNIEATISRLSAQNAHVTGSIAEPQGIRSRAARAGDDRSDMFRIVRETDDGVWLSGARTAGSCSAQCDEMNLGTIYYPHIREDESVWATIAPNVEGLSFVCRESTASARHEGETPSVVANRDEMDGLIVLDEVFVPRSRLFSVRAPELHSPALYGTISRGEHWSVMTRLCVKAEILAALAQMIGDSLDTSDIPVVRDQVAKVIEYSKILRAGVIAGESQATMFGGVLLPNASIVTAVRAYALDRYSEIMHIVQELCGQGLVVRFPDGEFDGSLGDKLERYLATSTRSGRSKNRLLNIVWELTTSSQAGRSALFESVNGLPAFILRQKLYGETMAERARMIDRVIAPLGL
jgi:4-hydroxyphenylacetate 3-monooxygenase